VIDEKWSNVFKNSGHVIGLFRLHQRLIWVIPISLKALSLLGSLDNTIINIEDQAITRELKDNKGKEQWVGVMDGGNRNKGK
jgi:hypothetical protein